MKIDLCEEATDVELIVQEGNVKLITGVHGTPVGNMSLDKFLLRDDIAAFGNNPNVDIHDASRMNQQQLSDVVNSPDTVIGGFCDSDVCLPKPNQ